jgi:hypothetical protein
VGTATDGGPGVPVVTASSGTLVAWPGQRVHEQVVGGRVRSGAPAGSPDGTLRLTLGRQQVTVPLRTAARLPGQRVS